MLNRLPLLFTQHTYYTNNRIDSRHNHHHPNRKPHHYHHACSYYFSAKKHSNHYTTPNTYYTPHLYHSIGNLWYFIYQYRYFTSNTSRSMFTISLPLWPFSVPFPHTSPTTQPKELTTATSHHINHYHSNSYYFTYHTIQGKCSSNEIDNIPFTTHNNHALNHTHHLIITHIKLQSS